MTDRTDSPIERLRASLADESHLWSRPLRLLAEALIAHCDAHPAPPFAVRVGTASGPGHIGPVFATAPLPMFDPPNAPPQVLGTVDGIGGPQAAVRPPGARRQTFGTAG